MDNSPSTYYHSAYVSKFNVEKRDADIHWQTTLSLSSDKLLAEARQTTGLTDFGSDEFLSPMQILLDSADSEGDLNPFDCQFSMVTMCAWILPSTAPRPNRWAIASAARSVASPSREASRASISLRSGVP